MVSKPVRAVPRAPILRVLSALAGVGLAFLIAPAWAAVCPPETGTYRVDVQIEIPPVVLHHDRSRAELGLLAFHVPTDQVLGVTAARLRAGTEIHSGSRTLQGEGACFWVERIQVTLRYEALDIYIASEYSRSSCQYEAILSHEEKHTEVARRYLDDYVETIRSALASLSIPKPRDPILMETAGKAQDKTQATIEALLEPILARLRRDMAEAQRRVDSPAEYRRVESQCPRW